MKHENIIDNNINEIDNILTKLTINDTDYCTISELLEEIRILSNAKDSVIETYKKEEQSLIISKFCNKIIAQSDCPPEFINLVNKEFWNLI